MDQYHRNYKNLVQLIPSLLEITGAVKLVALGYGDVQVEVIERHPHRVVLRMSHYLKWLSGASIPDPDITVEVHVLAETVGVLTYIDCFGSRKVFCPELMAFSPLAKVELNNFLEQWLRKLIAKGRCQQKSEMTQ